MRLHGLAARKSTIHGEGDLEMRASCRVYRVSWLILGVEVHHDGVCLERMCGHMGTCK